MKLLMVEPSWAGEAGGRSVCSCGSRSMRWLVIVRKQKERWMLVFSWLLLPFTPFSSGWHDSLWDYAISTQGAFPPQLDLPGHTIFLFLFLFYWIFSLFTFQMLSLFPVPPSFRISPSSCFYEGVPPPTHSLLTPWPRFAYTGASSFNRTKDLFSY